MPKDKLPKLITTLNRKKCLIIIKYIKDGQPKRFSDIKKKFDMKDKTLSTILSELYDLGIIEKTILEEEKGGPHAYKMTDVGMSIYGYLNNIRISLGGWYDVDFQRWGV